MEIGHHKGRGGGTGGGTGGGRGRGAAAGSPGHALWLSPHRPFFALAALWSVLALAWWHWGARLNLPVPSLGTPTLWHAHEMIVGFGGACMAAFFLTAMPNWTGVRRMSGAPLMALVGIWVLARLALALGEALPLAVVVAPGLAFYGLFGATFARAVWQGRRGDRVFLPVVIVALGLADAVFIAAARGAISWPDPAVMTRLLVLFFAIKVSVVAGGMTPAFTANWLRVAGVPGPAPGRREQATRLGLGLLLLALGLTLVGWPRVASGLLVAAGLVELWRLTGWRGIRARRYLPALMLHLAFGWLPLGLVLTGLAGLFATPWDEVDAIHALMMGAMGGLAMSIAGRAAARREGALLRPGPALVTAYGLTWGAAGLRLAAPMTGGGYALFLDLAAGAWCAGWGVFILGYLPALRGAVPRPVFNATEAGHGHGGGQGRGHGGGQGHGGGHGGTGRCGAKGQGCGGRGRGRLVQITT
ncbi:MAG: NnrS family protein [Rhodobacteraceae bacterium]|nr:NnrS family protein [Paracoccaceae bacterium]